ncbi:hypothetical protein [Abyssisolibacter fermentans]|uniref:hypothetical protein n=1 Tax=Abyssisolibacter fermentans TaxID=1766203 RepID=UPI00083655C3|nr:hypothetical protein [Abyssisolibacter fermentans]
MRKNIVVICLVIISFVCGYFFNSTFNEMNSSSDNNQLSYNIDTFKKVKNLIGKDFYVEGYEQIFKNQTDIVCVPNGIDDRQDLKDDGLYHRSKHYIYKNKKNGVIILMSITANNRNSKRKEWLHSMGYKPTTHNSNSNRYKDTYDKIFSKSEVYLYSFSGRGYNISLVGISDNPKHESVYTLNELAKFTDILAHFLDDHNL